MIDVQEAINGLIVTAATGTLAAIGWGIRKAIKNYGKTEAEIRAAKLEKALKALEKAHATPDKTDDLPAEKQVELAEKRLEWAHRLKSLTDGLSEPPGETPKSE
jgi:hypothetical protein